MSYRYPYGNTEQMNLDWFLNQWEKFKADWAEAEAGIDGSLDAEIAKVEAAMSELYAARDAAAASATAARQSSLDAAAAQVASGNNKTAAQAAETSARGSQQAAAESAQEAQASATGAENSALTATQAANTATQQAAGADAAKGAAEAAQQAAEAAQAAAAQSAGQAGQAATAAGDHADDAADSATLAQQAAQDMSDSVEQITTNKNDISDLKESITQEIIIPSENWEVGSYNYPDGANYTSTTRIRLTKYVGYSLGYYQINALSGYEFSVYAWETENNTYVGAWMTSNTFAETGTLNWVTSFDLTKFKGYIVKIALRNATNPSATMTVDLSTNCVFKINTVKFINDDVGKLQTDVSNMDTLLKISVIPLGWTLGRSIRNTGSTTVAKGSATSHSEPITKPFYRGGSLTDGNGVDLNVYVCQWNNGTFIERTLFNVLNTPFQFNSNCTHYRIVVGYASSTDLTMTQEIIDTYFKPYTYIPLQDVVDDVDMLKSYHADYSGKKLSILGDSISTFVPSADKVDDKAPTGCTTNYPGNPVQYENSSVTSVNLTWWGKVLSQFDMVLGINESWAGSTIGYNSNYTDSGKYTADNCMCSETRIGHLDENGTPDLIIVFGGTNDINHHLDGSNTRFAVGSLDTTNNPYDFDNFPMVTDTYYGSITTMLLRIQHEYPTATILMLLPYFCTYTHTSSGDIATPSDQNIWCNAAIDVCKFLGVEYLDLRTIINMYDVSTLLSDNLHPNANGMAAIAKAVIHKLNSML